MNDTKELVIVPRTLDEVTTMSERLSKATTLNAELRDKPANIMAAIMAGAELGFSPMASLRSVHIIKGVPKLSADAMVAAVLASGKALYFEPSESTHSSVTYVTKRVGSQREQSCTWTAEDAKRAGLVSDNHRLYPRQMLAARAKSELARSIYSDVLAGVYTEDEVPSEQTTEPKRARKLDDVIDAEIVDTSEPPEFAELAAAQTVEQLKGLTDRLSALRGSHRATARKRYQERLDDLRKAETAVEVVA